MPFMTSSPDLSHTIFSEGELRWARGFLSSGITKTDPTWLDAPQGVVGEYWLRDDYYAACFLVELARMICVVRFRTSSNSLPRLEAKINKLLRPSKRPAQSWEDLLELQVAATLVAYVSPLEFEPLVSKDGSVVKGKQPTSPDFAFDLPEGSVYLEVAEFHIGLLDNWEKAVEHITTTLQNRLFKQGRMLRLDLRLPLQELDANEITEYIWSRMHADSGELSVAGKGVVKWAPYPIARVQGPPASLLTDESVASVTSPPFGFEEVLFKMQVLEEGDWEIHMTPSGIYHSPAVQVNQVFVKAPGLAILSEADLHTANDLIIKALSNKLQYKRKQFRRKAPYLLVLKSGHYQLANEGLSKMIQRHTWNSRDYDWITGVILFSPRQGFLRSDPEGKLVFCTNPHARKEVIESLMSVFKEEKWLRRFNGPSE
jgi:hypothetical protein